MSPTLRILVMFIALVLLLPAGVMAGDAGDKHVWTVPTYVSQALAIRLETKATPELLQRIGEQCIDDDCKKQLDACKAAATCVLVPSKESAHETEVENN